MKQIPMRTADVHDPHGTGLIIAEIDERNRYYMTDRIHTGGPDGEKCEILKLSHVSNWDTTRAPKPPAIVIH